MTELTRALTADSFAAHPAHILEGIDDALAHATFPKVPHTLYAELWHIVFWQQISLDWIEGTESPVPAHASAGFPTPEQTAAEPWPQLRERFLTGMRQAGAHADDIANLDRAIRCPATPYFPVRVMTVRDQLISLAGHNAYHLGRMVLLRQLLGAWPQPAGGFTW
jgi:uncharacterized damage-inducible protein DinB